MSAQNLIWIDLEMSGLEPETCTILEIASIVTGPDLAVIAEGPDLVIHHPDAVLDAMDEWNTEHHTASGLVAAVRTSTISLMEAQRQTLEFLKPLTDAGQNPLCGNSVGNDRRFLDRYMPKLAAHLHYRIIDVSSVKELVRRWYGEDCIVGKSGAHRAREDILESIAELQHYRDRFFRPV